MRIISILFIALSLVAGELILSNNKNSDFSSQNISEISDKYDLPQPSSTTDELENYNTAVEEFQNYINSKKTNIKNDENLPFIMSHGKKTENVALLIHGLTDSPWYMKKIAESLLISGYNVIGILLSGHGTKPQDLKTVKYTDWQKDADAGIKIAVRLGNSITLGGFSTGGAVVSDIVRRYPELKIKNLLLFSPALAINEKERLKLMAGCISTGVTQIFTGEYLFDTGQPEDHPYRYRKMALNSVCQLYKLTGMINYGKDKSLIENLISDQTKIFIAATETDDTVSVKAMDDFIALLSKTNKTLYIKYSSSYSLKHADIPRPETNPYFKEMIDKMKDFISDSY